MLNELKAKARVSLRVRTTPVGGQSASRCVVSRQFNVTRNPQMDVVAGYEVVVAGIAGETYRQPEIIPSSERCYNSDGRLEKATELKGTQGEIIQKVGSVQEWHEEFLTRSSVQKGVVFSALTLARLKDAAALCDWTQSNRWSPASNSSGRSSSTVTPEQPR